jgi:phosphohistidine phosphatase SixA
LSVQPKGHGIVIGKIWHGSYRQTRETANILRQAVTLNGREITIEQNEALDPNRFWDTTKPDELKEFVQRLLDIMHALVVSSKDPVQSNAILVVGHAPHLSWIAEAILRHPTPIHRAAVFVAIQEVLENLPQKYSAEEFDLKCEAVYQLVYGSYHGAGRSVYGVAG